MFARAGASVSGHDPVSHLHANLQEKDRVKMEWGERVREEGAYKSPNDLPMKMAFLTWKFTVGSFKSLDHRCEFCH